MTRPDDDARAFREGAGAIEAALEAPVALQVQHAPARAGFAARCGAYGQVVWGGIGVTCPECLALMTARKSRRGRAGR